MPVPTLQFYPIDSVSGSLNLPDAYANTPYQTQLHASGGTGPYTYLPVSGIPSGLILSSAGVLSGSASFSGSAQMTVQVKDNVGSLTSALATINILSEDNVARPAYNTGTGFFVDATGLLRDPDGYRFTIRGMDRTFYNSSSWAGPANGALSLANTVRVLIFDNTTAANAVSYINTQYAPNNMVTILMMGYYNGTGTSGNTDPAIPAELRE